MCLSDSRVNTSVVRPVNPSAGSMASKGSQMLMVEVLGSLGKVPVSGPVTHSTPPTSISQRIVLQPVHTMSGVQYYRRPDGKLVRLVPVSQLRSGDPNLPLQKGESAGHNKKNTQLHQVPSSCEHIFLNLKNDCVYLEGVKA